MCGWSAWSRESEGVGSLSLSVQGQHRVIGRPTHKTYLCSIVVIVAIVAIVVDGAVERWSSSSSASKFLSTDRHKVSDCERWHSENATDCNRQCASAIKSRPSFWCAPWSSSSSDRSYVEPKEYKLNFAQGEENSCEEYTAVRRQDESELEEPHRAHHGEDGLFDTDGALSRA